MLIIEKINFPITFKKCANGKNITYHSEHGNGVWSDGWKSNLSLKYFINLHNEHNQSNSNMLRYYYEMAEHVSLPWDSVELMINNAPVNMETIYTASIGITDYRICKIEEMPVGATLKGIQDCNGEWKEITFKPGRVEVHDDVITLLSGYAGWRPKGDKAYGAEINIKRGANVKFS